MPDKHTLLEEDQRARQATDPLAETIPPIQAVPTAGPAEGLKRASLAPQALTAQHVQKLQRAAGNRAVSRLIGGSHSGKGPSIQRLWVNESAHYSSDRDDAHSKAKTALEAADSDQAISKKLYNKHKKAKHTGKCVTTFKTSTGGYLITVTYANLTKDKESITYDTAFLSKTVASKPESTAISYSPDSPTITVS